jgi:hypothetical protein
MSRSMRLTSGRVLHGGGYHNGMEEKKVFQNIIRIDPNYTYYLRTTSCRINSKH